MWKDLQIEAFCSIWMMFCKEEWVKMWMFAKWKMCKPGWDLLQKLSQCLDWVGLNTHFTFLFVIKTMNQFTFTSLMWVHPCTLKFVVMRWQNLTKRSRGMKAFVRNCSIFHLVYYWLQEKIHAEWGTFMNYWMFLKRREEYVTLWIQLPASWPSHTDWVVLNFQFLVVFFLHRRVWIAPRCEFEL